MTTTRTTMTTPNTLCALCGKIGAKSMCSSCESTWYCGADCQKGHWKAHKAECQAMTDRLLGSRLVSECILGNVMRVKASLDAKNQKTGKRLVNLNHTNPDDDGIEKGMFPLLAAVEGLAMKKSASPSSNLLIMDLLIKAGANVNHRGRDSQESAFYYAVDRNLMEAVRALITAGADVNLGNLQGTTPLHRAASKGMSELYNFLLVKGADPNKPDEEGSSPVMAAAFHGHVDAVRSLVHHGGKIETRNKRGESAVFLAAQNGHPNIIPVLLSLGADVNQSDNMGATPVFMAALQGHTNVLKALFACGGLLSINTPTLNGDTPLDAAIQGHKTETISLLDAHGGKKKEAL